MIEGIEVIFQGIAVIIIKAITHFYISFSLRFVPHLFCDFSIPGAKLKPVVISASVIEEIAAYSPEKLPDQSNKPHFSNRLFYGVIWKLIRVVMESFISRFKVA